MSEPSEPDALLSRLVGSRMYSVEFVLNDYVQFRFDASAPDAQPVTLNAYVYDAEDDAVPSHAHRVDRRERRALRQRLSPWCGEASRSRRAV